MKKIGIMSMQRIYNYGSFLQGYALKCLIEDLDEENQVLFVDYTPGIPLVASYEKELTGIKRTLFKLKEYSDVDSSLKNKIRFFNHKRTYAKRFFPLLGITKVKQDDSGLDVLVIGSDEVFNCVQSNTNVGYSRDLFGHNTKVKNVISYAGSFGNTTIKKINDYGIKQELTDDFAEFTAVSVRDYNSFQIVKELGVKEPVLNVDPVLAYDYMNLEKEIPQQRLYEGKYMVVYGYSGRLNSEENEILKDYAKKKGLKILCIGGVQGCCDEFIDCSPFELLAYFRDAESIVTDTFHGTIFSIINKRPFVTIIRKSVGSSYGNEEKLSYLLELFDLSSQKIDSMNNSNLSGTLERTMNYDRVFNQLDKQRIETLKYLKSAIK
jgi:hypothetical protein